MKLLIVAYYFPPESSSGSFRPLYFAKNLMDYGCQVSVLTSSKEFYLIEQPIDDALLDTLNSGVKVIRSRVTRPREALISLKKKLFHSPAKEEHDDIRPIQLSASGVGSKSTFQNIKDCITDLLAFPDPHVGWLPWALWDGRKIARSQEIDVIWATGSPWTCFLVGALLKKITGKPLVLDYRDPWGANPNMSLKNKHVAALEQKIEKAVVARADLITANTEELKNDFLVRFPFLRKDQVVTLPNGFEQFIESPTCKNNALTLTHAGSLYFSRNPFHLLKAVAELLDEGAIPSGEIIIKFIGGISIEDPTLDLLLSSPELQNVVQVYPRMALDKAIEHQLSSDVLFLLQPGFPLQIPRKLYEYISLRKPILAITDTEGATARIVRENNFGVVVPNTVNDLKTSLKKLWFDWKEGALSQPPKEKSDCFLNSHISKTLYDHLFALAGGDSGNATR